MVPDRITCETQLQSRASRIWANEITSAGAVPTEPALRHVRAAALGGAVLDLQEVGQIVAGDMRKDSRRSRSGRPADY
jgi:hypothetical protein